MKGCGEIKSDLIHSSGSEELHFGNFPIIDLGSVSSEAEKGAENCKHRNSASIWTGIWPPSLPFFRDSGCARFPSESKISASSGHHRGRSLFGKNHHDGWKSAIRRVVMNGGSMRRIWGFSRTWASASKAEIWLLGVCYQVSQEGDECNDPTQSEGFCAFVEDFSSRIWITYRKGFSPIGDSKYSSDANWGCMLRSSQMLVAQAFLFLKLGRSWRKPCEKPYDHLDLLQLFGDSEESPCSIHNLLKAGMAYGLSPGSWVGPYAMCRAWECLLRNSNNEFLGSMMALHVVSGDEDGERGGAPVLCTEDVSRRCYEFSRSQMDWAPILLLVPLVLGLEKINPRYIPLLSATFTFPQSLGILGGRPGASTYIVGVQDEKAIYLDPHDIQQAVDMHKGDVDSGILTYHCNVVRQMPLDSIDSSLAVGFFCRDKSDFDDFCSRASELMNESNGAPLFTISSSRTENNATPTIRDDDIVDGLGSYEQPQEDDWQLV